MSTEPTRRYAEDVDLDAAIDDYPAPLRERVEVGERPSRIPDHAPRPQDRKPAATADPDPEPEVGLEPVFNEALGILVATVYHDGLVLELPADPEDWPITATRAFEQGKVITAVENILSTEDFNKVLKKGYRNKDFGKLYEALARAGGFENSGN